MTPRYLYRSVVDKGAHAHVDMGSANSFVVLWFTVYSQEGH